MGWKCNQCGNTESFVEINAIETEVTQDSESTRILAVHNRYRENNQGPLNVWCKKCDSEDVQWVKVANQQAPHITKGSV